MDTDIALIKRHKKENSGVHKENSNSFTNWTFAFGLPQAIPPTKK
jgi:hypothetical protein